MKCPSCEKEIPDGSKFCNHCGAKMNAAPSCPSCGAELELGSRFCNHCGKPVNSGKRRFADEKPLTKVLAVIGVLMCVAALAALVLVVVRLATPPASEPAPDDAPVSSVAHPVTTPGASGAETPASPGPDGAFPYTVADDDVCKLVITSVEVSSTGNVRLNYELENRTSDTIYLTVRDAWDVDGVQAEVTTGAEKVGSGKTLAEFFFLDGSVLAGKGGIGTVTGELAIHSQNQKKDIGTYTFKSSDFAGLSGFGGSDSGGSSSGSGGAGDTSASSGGGTSGSSGSPTSTTKTSRKTNETTAVEFSTRFFGSCVLAGSGDPRWRDPAEWAEQCLLYLDPNEHVGSVLRTEPELLYEQLGFYEAATCVYDAQVTGSSDNEVYVRLTIKGTQSDWDNALSFLKSYRIIFGDDGKVLAYDETSNSPKAI